MRKSAAILGTSLIVGLLILPPQMVWAAEGPHSAATARNSVSAVTAEPVTVSRVGGVNAVDTAVKISQQHWKSVAAATGNAADAVVVVRKDSYYDGVPAIPLAKHKKGPLLMTSATALDSLTADEITRVLPAGKTVYIAGGTGAVSAEVETAIKGLGYATRRFAGTDHYDTALRIARDGIVTPRHVVIASSNDWKDPISAAAAVAAADGAIVLSNGGSLATGVTTWLNGLPADVTKNTVGGPARNAYPSTDGAIVGTDAYETNAMVSERFTPNPGRVGLTTVSSFTDGLGGGAYAATVGMPMLLNPPAALEQAPEWFATDHSATARNVTLFGGTTALTDTVAAQAKTAATETFLTGEVVPPGATPKSREEVNQLAITPDWALEGQSAALATQGYTGGMNDAEYDFCKWPSRWSICDNARKSANLAEAWSNAEGMSSGAWPGSAGNGGRKDAYRHCIWNVHMTMQMGTKTAKGFADRHELGPKPPAMTEAEAQRHHRMDYHNNAKGRFFGEEAKLQMRDPGLTFDQAYAAARFWCLLSVNDGDLHYLKP
ncbi:cell wall-binding repeat-containing protein [Streptomyces sp. Je 1-79]|uniref:cell wall-binding repeat-containing protein n=1 Tax=Streptomyces sp. Je 1-79 TaxID=2943847 RepID=UPI0021A2DB81|nr:cell wall-binding repeat-containing protein [Streptomyces sp. Je 1-79]MCT4356291.1 cell wall-binding repeat-containing protein [Streptomyces sp. Je 1-79]